MTNSGFFSPLGSVCIISQPYLCYMRSWLSVLAFILNLFCPIFWEGLANPNPIATQLKMAICKRKECTFTFFTAVQDFLKTFAIALFQLVRKLFKLVQYWFKKYKKQISSDFPAVISSAIKPLVQRSFISKWIFPHLRIVNLINNKLNWMIPSSMELS